MPAASFRLIRLRGHSTGLKHRQSQFDSAVRHQYLGNCRVQLPMRPAAVVQDRTPGLIRVVSFKQGFGSAETINKLGPWMAEQQSRNDGMPGGALETALSVMEVENRESSSNAKCYVGRRSVAD